MTCWDQKLESFTMDQETLRAEMLQQTAILYEGRNNLTHLQEGQETLRTEMTHLQKRKEDELQHQTETMVKWQEGLGRRCTRHIFWRSTKEQQRQAKEAESLFTNDGKEY